MTGLILKNRSDEGVHQYDHFDVKADLPGIDPKNLDISLTGNILTIRGEKKEEREEKNERYYTIERQFGSFSRSFMLPSDVKEDGIEASYKAPRSTPNAHGRRTSRGAFPLRGLMCVCPQVGQVAG
ncbi:MAG: Hsp20/alpha crystallin family protein, partial [Syntrophobacteraceae bacterium]